MTDKIMIKAHMIKWYKRLAYTHAYIFGFAINGIVYGAVVENGADLLPYITTIDRASSKNGGGYSLKYKMNKELWNLIVTNAIAVAEICTTEYLEELNRTTKHNRGQIYEALVAKTFGGTQQTKANAKFTECGDVVINGKDYQVKYMKATFTTETTIQNLRG